MPMRLPRGEAGHPYACVLLESLEEVSGEAFESSVDSVRFTDLARRVVCGCCFAASVLLLSSSIKQRSLSSLISWCTEFQGFSLLSDAIRTMDRSSSPHDF